MENEVRSVMVMVDESITLMIDSVELESLQMYGRGGIFGTILALSSFALRAPN